MSLLTTEALASGPVLGTPPAMQPFGRARLRRRARRRVGLVAGLVVLAALTYLAVRPPPPPAPGVGTVVAVRDIRPGSMISAEDVEVVLRPAADRPAMALSEASLAVGRTAAGGILAREVLTSTRLVGTGLFAGVPLGRRAMAVPVVTGAGLGVIAGDRVDLYRSDTGAKAVGGVLVLGWARGAAGSTGMSGWVLPGGAAASGGGGDGYGGGVARDGGGGPGDGGVGYSGGGGDGDGSASVLLALTDAEAALVAEGLGGGGDRGFHMALLDPRSSR